MFKIITFLILSFQVSFLFAQDLTKYRQYSQIDSLVDDHRNKKQLEKAITVLESAKTRFPESLEQIIKNLTLLYIRTNQFEKAIDNYLLGQSKGLYFAFYPGEKTYEPLYKIDRFKKFIEENNRKIAEAQNSVKPIYAVTIPANFQKTKKYPLFIALHGWGEDVSFFRNYWKVGKSGNHYIFGFIQSSQLVGMNAYGWNNTETSRKDITGFYNWLKKNYQIDESMIIIGGFSQGGKMAVDIAINQVIPVKGFVALCPGGNIAESLDISKIKAANQLKISGQIISGEKDGSLKDQKKLVDLLSQNGFRYEFSIIPGMTHWFPKDFPDRLDKSIEFITNYK